jgi:ChpA-C
VQMKTRVAGVLATSACGIVMMGAPAFASVNHSYTHLSNVGNVTILSGNTLNMPISVPVDVCGNAIAILGFAEASCQGGAGVFLNSPDSGW